MQTLDLLFAQKLLHGAGCHTEERAQCLATLMRRSREGHLCTHFDEVLQELPETLVAEKAGPFPAVPLIRDGKRYYLQKDWVLETHILQHIRRLHSLSPAPLFNSEIFHNLLLQRKELFPEQIEAMRKAFTAPFFLLCGGPGTGKTYTASTFLRLLLASLREEENVLLRLAAPTGKAASDLQKALLSHGPLPPSVRVETSTLHRLLHLQPGEIRLFSKRRIDADIVVVDEASMIDTPLLAHLVEAIGGKTRLLMMGDPSQLPPVGNSSLFPELASLFSYQLQTCARTKDSILRELATSIRAGSFEKGVELRLSHPLDASLVLKLYEYIQPIRAWSKPDPQKCLEHYSRVRILNALRQGPFGADVLNQRLLDLLNAKISEGQWWALPLLVTANDPYSGFYNGMEGILIGRNPATLQNGEAVFPGKIDTVDLPHSFELAFCLSIHKSQGSEFDEVIALFPSGSERFGKESLYTAVTRAKKKFSWIGEEETLRAMLTHSARKTSGFIERWGEFQ